MARRRPVLLAAVGLGSEIVYLAIVQRLSWWHYGGSLTSWSLLLGGQWSAFGACLAGIGLLLLFYLWGWYLVGRGKGGRRMIWVFAVLFSATLFWLLPITSDLFTYLSQAHLFTDLGGNPFLDVPLDFSDPLLYAYPALYSTRPSVYGPAWVLLSALGTLGRFDVAAGLFYLKGLVVVAYLACAWLLERILQQVQPAVAEKGLYLFAWNPLVLLMAIGDGHNDIVMMALVLLALWSLLQERWVLAFGVLALSACIKYVSAIFFPFFVVYTWHRPPGKQLRERWSFLAKGGLAALLVSVLAFAPFWTLDRIPGIVQRFLQPVNWQGAVPPLSALTLRLGLFLFAAACAFLIWQMIRGPASYQRLVNICFSASLLAFVLGATRSQPWHLIWSVTLAGLSSWRWAWPGMVGLSAVMLVVQVWVEWGAPGISIFS